MTIRLRQATAADIADIVDVSAAAFDPSTDVISRRLFPPQLNASDDGKALRQWSIARKSARLQSKRTAITVAVDDAIGDKVVGYSIWFLPVRQGEAEELPPPKVAFPGMDRGAFAELRGIIEEDARYVFGKDGSEHVWNLDSLGVSPEHQRRGIGRLLLESGVKDATAEGKECYLVATPSGLGLYLAAGFEHVRTVDIFNSPHVSMRRRVAPK